MAKDIMEGPEPIQSEPVRPDPPGWDAEKEGRHFPSVEQALQEGYEELNRLEPDPSKWFLIAPTIEVRRRTINEPNRQPPETD